MLTADERQAEIEHWLQQHGEGRPSALLDEQPLLFVRGCRNLVVTESEVGLTRQALQAVDEILGLSSP